MGKNILIIHFSRLGDMIQSLPAVKLLSETEPRPRITYACLEEFSRPLRHVPWIDELVSVPLATVNEILNEKGIKPEVVERWIEGMPPFRRNYDLLINWTHNQGSGYLCSRINSIRKEGRISGAGNEILVSGNWGKYLFAAVRHRTNNPINMSDIYIGMTGVKHRPASATLPTDPESDAACRERLWEMGLCESHIPIGLQLGASSMNRVWPVENFIRLGEMLSSRLNARIVLFGSEKERGLAEMFLRGANFPTIDLVGQTRINDLPPLLKCVRLLVSNDTGPMHIAAAVGTGTVGIFASTAYFSLTGPYGEGHIAVQSNYPCAPCLNSTRCDHPLCAEAITVETVWEAVCLALGEAAGGEKIRGAALYRSSFTQEGLLDYRPVSGENNSFAAWLISRRDMQSRAVHALWAPWLGLERRDAPVRTGDGGTAFVFSTLGTACVEYLEIYREAMDACRSILREFRRDRPRIEYIKSRIEMLNKTELKIIKGEAPPLLKEINEFIMAEAAVCNFPQLARELLEKYAVMANIVTRFERGC